MNLPHQPWEIHPRRRQRSSVGVALAVTNLFALQEAGGWHSLAMPRRYEE
ncbi:MAG: hypothetical protein HC893_10985 [Chloroflexaceae bacterium]|nr:hypothetical protein [Chloroflexaceae bacterium]